MLAEFSRTYGLIFKRQELLKLALTHRSYLSVTGGSASESNERLEVLGDSVLGLVTSESLFRSRPGEHEGQLTKTKSLLVSKAILSRRALAMGLGRFVLMSHSEVESGGRQRLSILADAFESVIGAVYLDLGFEAARAFIDRWLLKDAREIVADKRHVNYKSHLQEYVQSTFRTHPVYRIRSEIGPDHSKHFMVEVVAGRRVLGEGRGHNKKEAEQAAARQALDRVTERGETDSRGRAEARTWEPREVRERRAMEEGERAEPRTVPEVVAPVATPEGDEERRGRRRGRRGGRGRRRVEAQAEPGSARPMPAAESDERATGADPARRDVRRDPERREGERREVERSERREAVAPERRRVERPRFERVERPREIEPLPPAAAEDELEEVGRPEGPAGERYVDPFASESAEPVAMHPVADPFRAPTLPVSGGFAGSAGESSGGGIETAGGVHEESGAEEIDDEPEVVTGGSVAKEPEQPGRVEPRKEYGRRRGRRNPFQT